MTFETKEGSPETLAKIVLYREMGRFQHSIEYGSGMVQTGVVLSSAKVEIISGLTEESTDE